MPCTSKVGWAMIASASCWSSREAHAVQLVRGLEALAREARPPQARPLAGGQLADVVVEAGDLHLAGAGVVTLGDQRGQLADRVAGGAAGRARVHVLGPGLQAHGEAHQAAQAVGQRRPARRQPDGVGHRPPRRCAKPSARAACRPSLEVGAADLFLQLPQELQVGLHAVARRQPGAVAGRSAPGPCRRWCRGRTSAVRPARPRG